MKNKLTDLNDHLFSRLEALGDEDTKGEALEEEIRRSKATVEIAETIVLNARVVLDAHKAIADFGVKKSDLPLLGE